MQSDSWKLIHPVSIPSGWFRALHIYRIKESMSKEITIEILGVQKSYRSRDKKAYRQMALKFHPDKNPAIKKRKINSRKLWKHNEVLSNAGEKTTLWSIWSSGSRRIWRTKWWNEYGRYLLTFRRYFWIRRQSIPKVFGGNRGGVDEENRGTNLRIKVTLTLSKRLHGVEKKIKSEQSLSLVPLAKVQELGRWFISSLYHMFRYRSGSSVTSTFIGQMRTIHNPPDLSRMKDNNCYKMQVVFRFGCAKRGGSYLNQYTCRRKRECNHC